MGTLKQLCHIIKSKIVKGQKSHFPFRNGLCLFQWLNASPSAVNPIFQYIKRRIPVPILHLQGPLQIISENGDLCQKANIKNRIQQKKWIVRHCFYVSVSTAYITRSFLGIVNACDPIVSTGLSESILKNKKETSRQKNDNI